MYDFFAVVGILLLLMLLLVPSVGILLGVKWMRKNRATQKSIRAPIITITLLVLVNVAMIACAILTDDEPLMTMMFILYGLIAASKHILFVIGLFVGVVWIVKAHRKGKRVFIPIVGTVLFELIVVLWIVFGKN